MRKIWAFLLLLVIVIAIVCVWVFSTQFRRVNISNQYAEYLSDAFESNALSVEYKGEKRELTDNYYLDSLLRVLTRGRSEIRQIKSAPETYDDVVTLNIGKLTMTYYWPDEKKDSVILAQTVDNRTTYWSLTGYRTFEWVLYAAGIDEQLR